MTTDDIDCYGGGMAMDQMILDLFDNRCVAFCHRLLILIPASELYR